MVTEIINVGSVFGGIGSMVFLATIAYFILAVTQSLRSQYNVEALYDTLESCLVKKFSLKKGVDLEKEQLNNELRGSASFRKMLKKELFQEFLSKQTQEKLVK